MHESTPAVKKDIFIVLVLRIYVLKDLHKVLISFLLSSSTLLTRDHGNAHGAFHKRLLTSEFDMSQLLLFIKNRGDHCRVNDRNGDTKIRTLALVVEIAI